MRGPLIAVIMAAILSGCRVGHTGLSDVSGDTALSEPAADAIAGDMVSRLAELVAPSGAAIKLQDSNSTFGVALEDALERWGYKVAAGPDPLEGDKVVTLSYALDAFDGKILIRLSTSSVTIGRAYTATAARALPISALSVARSS